MKLNVGETCVLLTRTVLWWQYPPIAVCTMGVGTGKSYKHFDSGDIFTIIGELLVAGKSFSYVLDCTGNTYVSPTEYLSHRVRIMR